MIKSGMRRVGKNIRTLPMCWLIWSFLKSLKQFGEIKYCLCPKNGSTVKAGEVLSKFDDYELPIPEDFIREIDRTLQDWLVTQITIDMESTRPIAQMLASLCKNNYNKWKNGKRRLLPKPIIRGTGAGARKIFVAHKWLQDGESIRKKTKLRLRKRKLPLRKEIIKERQIGDVLEISLTINPEYDEDVPTTKEIVTLVHHRVGGTLLSKTPLLMKFRFAELAFEAVLRLDGYPIRKLVKDLQGVQILVKVPEQL